MNINNLPIEILNHLLYNLLDMKSILQFCSITLQYSLINILTKKQIKIIRNSQKGWNYCLEKDHLKSIQRFIEEKYQPYTLSHIHSKDEWNDIINNVVISYPTIYQLNPDIKKRYIMKRYQNEKFNMFNDGVKIFDLKMSDTPIELEFNKFLFYHNQRHHEFALKLFDNDHTINLIGNYELSYYIACRYGHLKLVQFFEDYCHDLNYELAMIYACFSSNDKLFEYLYSKANHIDLSKLFYYCVSLASLSLFAVKEYAFLNMLNIYGENFPQNINSMGSTKWIIKKYSEIHNLTDKETISQFINPNQFIHFDSSYIIALMKECDDCKELYDWIYSLDPVLIENAIDPYVWDLEEEYQPIR